MKKKILVLVVFLLLIGSTIQVAFADPPADDPDNIGSCHMIASWWEPLPDGVPAPGNAYGVQVEDAVDPDTGEVIAEDVQQRGMAMAHYSGHPDWYTNGAIHMDEITIAHCY